MSKKEYKLPENLRRISGQSAQSPGLGKRDNEGIAVDPFILELAGVRSSRPGLDEDAPLEEAMAANVGGWIDFLSAKLTQADMRDSAREAKRGIPTNTYRLGHYMGAVGKIRDAHKDILQSNDPESLTLMRKTVSKYISDTAITNALFKAMDKNPAVIKYPIAKKVK